MLFKVPVPILKISKLQSSKLIYQTTNYIISFCYNYFSYYNYFGRVKYILIIYILQFCVQYQNYRQIIKIFLQISLKYQHHPLSFQQPTQSKTMNIVRKNIASLFKTIQFELCESKIQNKIGFIYMNSPKDYNALSVDMKSTIISNIKQFQSSNDVKVIVLLSKVAKAFCAGANIKQFQNKTSKDFENNDIFKQFHDTLYEAKKPIIAGVNGVALGGGCEMSLLCDLIYCSEQAKFGLPELKLGLIPGIGGTQRMAKLIGRTNTMHYILTSNMIPAQRAKQLGLVTQVFKTQQLHNQVIKIATQITNKPLSAILAAKECIRQTENLSMNEGVALQRKLFYPLYDTEGVKEGVSAFVEKRPAKLRDL